MKKRMVSEGMKRARHMAVEARAKYPEIKADVESRVVRWEWTTFDRYSYEPAYFEINKFPRGNVIADEKEAPIPPQQYGFDAEGRVIVERQYTEFPGMIHETFYIHEPDGIMQIHQLVTYANNIVKQLETNPQKVTTPFGASFDSALAASAITNALTELSARVDDTNREARELEEAQTNRNRALDAWSDAYQGAAAALEGLYIAAGYRELADRVRPTQRKLRGEDPGEEPTGANETVGNTSTGG